MRFILERGVVNGAALLDEIERRISLAKGSARPTRLHLTCLYVGDAEELAGEVSAQTGRGRKSVLRDLMAFADSSVSAYASHREENIVQLSTLGSTAEPVIAAILDPSSELLREREALWGGLVAVVRRAGVEMPEKFLSTSSTLRMPSPTWTPHVTLIKGRSLETVTDVATIKVSLGPLRMHM